MPWATELSRTSTRRWRICWRRSLPKDIDIWHHLCSQFEIHHRTVLDLLHLNYCTGEVCERQRTMDRGSGRPRECFNVSIRYWPERTNWRPVLLRKNSWLRHRRRIRNITIAEPETENHSKETCTYSTIYYCYYQQNEISLRYLGEVHLLWSA